jgi:hypothetical protein
LETNLPLAILWANFIPAVRPKNLIQRSSVVERSAVNV